MLEDVSKRYWAADKSQNKETVDNTAVFDLHLKVDKVIRETAEVVRSGQWSG